MTLFRPAIGEVRAKGVISVTNAVFHPWLQEQLLSILACEEEARNKAGHQPASADGGGNPMSAVGDLGRLATPWPLSPLTSDSSVG